MQARSESPLAEPSTSGQISRDPEEPQESSKRKAKLENAHFPIPKLARIKTEQRWHKDRHTDKHKQNGESRSNPATRSHGAFDGGHGPPWGAEGLSSKWGGTAACPHAEEGGRTPTSHHIHTHKHTSTEKMPVSHWGNANQAHSEIAPHAHEASAPRLSGTSLIAPRPLLFSLNTAGGPTVLRGRGGRATRWGCVATRLTPSGKGC